MGYGVELSSRTTLKAAGQGASKATSKIQGKSASPSGGQIGTKAPARQVKKKARGRRGIDRNGILEAGFHMLAAEGEAGFSVRKLAAKIGVDPMTVLHHFQSREALLRSIADHSLASVELPLPSGDWRRDLLAVANAYRALARRYPKVFHLHFRFNATGPADHASSEVVYRAMRATGLPDPVAAGLGLAFYAFVLGFALAETEGLLAPLSETEEGELFALDPLGYPATRAFIPAFKKLDAQAAFDNAFAAFVSGVAARAKG